MKDVYREDMEAILADPVIPWENLRGKSVLVTGATGLLGKLAVKTLAALNQKQNTGCKILAQVRDIQKAERVFAGERARGGQPDFVVSDIRDLVSVEGPVDYIIHAASETASKLFIERPVEILETAVMGTRNLLRIAKEKHISGMVFLSTMEVYGTPQTDEKITEERVAEVRPNEVRASYPAGKIACENLCISYADEYDVPVNVLRLTQTFGPGVDYNDGRVFAEFARCVIEDRDITLKTTGETRRSYLYTTDAIRAVFLLLLQTKREKKETYKEIYNIANEETYCSIAEMAERVVKACGGGSRAVRFNLTQDTGELGYAPTLCMNLDTSKLRRLGWKPEVGLEEMYRRMITDMKGT